MKADLTPGKPDHLVSAEPARRGGSIALVLIIAVAVVAAAVAFMVLGRSHAQPFILGLISLLAMVGLFTLFAFAAGIVRFADRGAENPLMKPMADNAFDGLAVTDARGHIVYYNNAYLALTGAANAQEVRPVERVFIGNPDVSEAVFRLLKAAKEGKRQQEEVRVTDAERSARWPRARCSSSASVAGGCCARLRASVSSSSHGRGTSRRRAQLSRHSSSRRRRACASGRQSAAARRARWGCGSLSRCTRRFSRSQSCACQSLRPRCCRRSASCSWMALRYTTSRAA